MGPGLSETSTRETQGPGLVPAGSRCPGPVLTEAQQVGPRAAQPQLAGQGREAAARRAVADLGQHLGHGVQVLRDVLRAAPSARCPRPSRCPSVPASRCPRPPVSRCPRSPPSRVRYLQRGRAQERARIGHHVRHTRHVRAPHGPARPGCRSRRGARWERQHRASASGRRGQVTSWCHMTARAGAGSGSGAAAGNSGDGRGVGASRAPQALPSGGGARRGGPGAARPRALPARGGTGRWGEARREGCSLPRGLGGGSGNPGGSGDGEASVPEGGGR